MVRIIRFVQGCYFTYTNKYLLAGFFVPQNKLSTPPNCLAYFTAVKTGTTSQALLTPTNDSQHQFTDAKVNSHQTLGNHNERYLGLKKYAFTYYLTRLVGVFLCAFLQDVLYLHKRKGKVVV